MTKFQVLRILACVPSRVFQGLYVSNLQVFYFNLCVRSLNLLFGLMCPISKSTIRPYVSELPVYYSALCVRSQNLLFSLIRPFVSDLQVFNTTLLSEQSLSSESVQLFHLNPLSSPPNTWMHLYLHAYNPPYVTWAGEIGGFCVRLARQSRSQDYEPPYLSTP